MKTLSVPIEEQYAHFIAGEIESGNYKNETGVITEALRLLQTAKNSCRFWRLGKLSKRADR